MRYALLFLAACGSNPLECDLDAMETIQTFQGPGWPATTAAGPFYAHATFAATTTEGHQAFLDYSETIAAEMAQAAGLIGMTYAHSPVCKTVRTVSVWEDEDAMVQFMYAGTHAEAMGKFRELAKIGALGSFTVTAEELPLTVEAGRPHLSFGR